MKRETLLTAVVGAFLLSASHPAVAGNDHLSSVDRLFVKTVAQGNMAEVMTSKLALNRSKDEKVRMIASMLIKDHGQALADLKGTAKTLKVRLPGDVDSKHKSAYRRLSRLSGSDFDKAFLKGQVQDHYATIALFKKEMNSGTDSTIRSYAAKYEPGIENHTLMITGTASRFGINVSQDGTGRAIRTGTASAAIHPGMKNGKGM